MPVLHQPQMSLSVLRLTRTPVPRSKEGIHPGRISHMRNVRTPTRSAGDVGSKSTARKTVALVGGGGTKKRKLPAERQREMIYATSCCTNL